MDNKVTYYFACGHHGHKCKSIRACNGRIKWNFCPDCYNLRQSAKSEHNQNCRLVRVAFTCQKCGVEISRKSANINDRRWCPACLKKGYNAAYSAERAKRKESKIIAPVEPKRGCRIVSVLCPKCRKQHKISTKEEFNTNMVKWKFCPACVSAAKNGNGVDDEMNNEHYSMAGYCEQYHHNG